MGAGLQAGTATDQRTARLPGHAILLAAALLLTVVAYVGTLQFQFVYDDLPQIVHNPAVQSWHFAAGYFTHHVWSHVYPTWPGNYYRPVFLLWLLLNWTAFGLQPLGWHLTTVAAHLGMVAMVYWLARRITGDAAAAAIAALLFGVHPIHLETVAWISGVSEPLLGLLFIGAFMFYAKARDGQEHRALRLMVSLLLYALALLSKETAIVLPALIFGNEWLRTDEREGRRRTSEKLRAAAVAIVPYAAISVGYLALRAFALKGAVHPDAEVTPATVLLTLPSLVWFYARHLVAPWPLGLFYDVGYVLQPTAANFVLPLLFALLSGAALWVAARRSRAAAAAILWLVLPLLPPLGGIAVFAAGDIAHDRYLYLPSIGFCILVAIALRRLANKGGAAPAVPVAQFAAVGVIGLALTVATMVQSVYWANNLLLYHRGVQMAPRNALARSHLATEMLARNDITTALRLYQEAHDLDPNAWSSNFILGYTNFSIGRFREAEPYFRRGIEITPTNANQYFYLGLTLMNLGRLDEAASTARRAIQLWDKGPGFHYGLGLILQRKGDLAGARDQYAAELKIDPNSGARQQLAEVEALLAGGTPSSRTQ